VRAILAACLWLLPSTAGAETKPFPLAGGTRLLERTDPAAGVFLRAFRPNRMTGRWEVEVVVTNGSARALRTPLVLRFERADSIAPGVVGALNDPEGRLFLDLTALVGGGEVAPGATLPPFTLALGDGQTPPTLQTALYSAPALAPPSLALVRTLTADGLPLPGVSAVELGPLVPRTNASAAGGWLTLESGPGVRGWRVEREGQEPVIRLASELTPGMVTELPSIRRVVASLTGSLTFPTEAVPVPLPRGWSPAVVLRALTGSQTVELFAPMPTGQVALLARWDDAELVWRAVRSVAGEGRPGLTLEFPTAGLFALLVPDAVPVTPRLPGANEILGGVLTTGEATSLRATGQVNPVSRAASREAALVTTTATVEFTSTAGPLSSGLKFPCQITEEYQLRDGTRRQLPAYTLQLVAYRQIGGVADGPVVAQFPLRPFQLLNGEELAQARVRIEVLAPATFAGGVLNASGGALANGSLRVTAATDAFARPEAALLRPLSVPNPSGLVPAGLELNRAFELSVADTQAGQRLSVQTGPVPPNQTFVLARAVFDEGRHGFQPVQRFVSDAAGELSSVEPMAGEALGGVTGGGQYWLFQTPAAEALVSGVARNATGQPAAGLRVRRGPWTAFTETTGRFQLLAPAGRQEISVLDAASGDSGQSAVEVGEALTAVVMALDTAPRGPRVVSVSPSNQAANVPRVTPVVVNFNRPLNPVTVIAGGLRVLDSTDAPIPTSVTLNLAGTTVTLLPTHPLAAGGVFRVRVADTVLDLTARPVEGDREFRFTTVDDSGTRGVAAQVTVYEPGATNLTAELLNRIPAYDPRRDRDGVVVEGSPGTAESAQPVILVNESSGETETVLAEIDGSFVSFIRGTVDDFISAVLVNANGTRNQLPATRQRFDDGTVGLFGSGGTLRSTGLGVPVDLIVDPGAIAGKTLFKLESMLTNTFAELVAGNFPEESGPLLGAFELTESGDPLLSAADISVPVKLADLGLPPGSNPTNFAFLVVMPLKVEGRLVYQIVDQAKYEATGPEGGRVRTASPPFVGMLARKLAGLARGAELSVVTTPKIASNNDNPHKGETAAFGILSLIARGPLEVGGFVRSLTRNPDGTVVSQALPGATVRIVRLEDDQNPDAAPLVFDGDLVALSDERGNFGFLFRPAQATPTRLLQATHPRYPFQRPRTGASAGERQGTTVVNAELHFLELPPSLTAVQGTAPPQVTVGHEPALPTTGIGAGAGATLFVVGVDDKLVGPPGLRIVSVQNLQGESLEISGATLTPLPGEADQPGRKVRQFRLHLNQPGRVVLTAAVADDLGQSDSAQHAVSFGVSRPPVPPGDPTDVAALRVIFAWPPPSAANLPALTPITLRFNRALPANLLQPGQLDWLTLDAEHSLRRVTPTSDRRELTLFYEGKTTGRVSLTVGPGIRGDSGRSFDQEGEESGDQPFALEFSQTVGITTTFDGQTGAGVLLQGRFAYALERKNLEGTLKVFDFADPREPEELHSIRVGYPTALALIPNYSLSMTEGGPCSPQDLLALFTGHANEPKYLQLGQLNEGRVTFGRRMILSGGGSDASGRPSVAEGVTQVESLSQIVKTKWSPPYLGYLELGADVTSIRLLNLATFQQVVTREGQLDQFPDLPGFDGEDANGDSDFCDPDDQLPRPSRDPLQPPGLAFSTAPRTRAERMDDFDFDAGLGLMVGLSRFVGTNLPPRFATLLASTDTNSLDAAFVDFAVRDSPRRVLLLLRTTLETPTNRIVRDLALVTLGGAGDGSLAVVDVTIPSAPKILNRFAVPTGEGTPAGIQMRPDGLLAVATSRSTLLLDPALLGLPTGEMAHPSIVGRVDGTGTGVRDFVADASGINLTHGGGTRRYVETAPQFSFVHFNAPINPRDLAAQSPQQVERFLRTATPVRAAEVTLAGNGSTPPEFEVARQYYVLVEAPGGAANPEGLLPLVLSAVDHNGLPQPDRGGTVVPAVIGDEQLYSALISRRFLELIFTVVNLRRGVGAIANAPTAIGRITVALASANEAKKSINKLLTLASKLRLLPDRFVARRLTDDPDHPLYNRFLAGPFLVLGGSPSAEQLSALRDQAAARELDRVYLRPSPRLWVGFPSERERSFLQTARPFAPEPTKLKSFVSQLRLNPIVRIAGVNVPLAGELIEQAASLSAGAPGNPIGNFFDQGETVTLMVSLLGNIPVVSAVLQGEWQPLLLPGAHGLLRVNFAERPLILVPGFAGSKLEVNDANAWVSLALTAEGRELRSLRVRPDGTPEFLSFATDAVRFSVETPLVDLQPIYGNWIDHLTGELGLTEYHFRRPGLLGTPDGSTIRLRLRLDGEPLLLQAPTPNLFVFPYDWRLDNQKSAEQLRDYIRLALELHPDADGVDLVGHSNGGLVARAYMLLPGQRPLVKRLITVGTPWLGASKPLAGLRTGDLNETGINIVAPIPAVRKMLQFAPGAHQLLPTQEYFALGFRPLIEDGFDINTNGVANEAFEFAAYLDVLAKHFLRQPVEELGLTLAGLPDGEHPVRKNANRFHAGQPIGDHRGDNNDVEMHHLVGMGSVPDTIGQIRVRGRLVPQLTTTNVTVSLARVTSRESEQVPDGADALINPGDGTLAVNPTNQFRLNEEIEVRYVTGDGTVPIASLARGFGSDLNFNAEHAKLYPLVGAFQDELTGHNPMLNTDIFMDLFDQVFGGRAVEQVTVTVSESGGFTEGSLGSLTVSGTLPRSAAGSISFVVDFGDGGVELRQGTAGTEVSVAHRYRQNGTYLVTVGAAADAAVFGLTSRRVVVANSPPEVTLEGGDFTVDRGETRVLTARVRDLGLDDHHTFVWTLPGGQARGVNQFAVPVTFEEPGTTTVSVAVNDGVDVRTASIRVTVRGQAPGQPAPNFGPDSALAATRARRASLVGFAGGHPELIVRVNGHAPGALETTGLSAKQEGLSSAILGGVLQALDPAGLLGATVDRFILPRVARFLGQLAQDTEYVRLVRELPDEVAGIDLAATRAFVGARGQGHPLEVDLLYLEGGIPKVLRRWQIPQVSTNEGVRLKFDWIELEGVLERVVPETAGGGTLNGSPLETLAPTFSAFSEQAAGDRQGPATVGILNPALDQVTVLGRDNLTSETNLVLFAVFDANENGRLDDDTFYPLDTNVVTFARLPKRPFAIVGVDEQGNVGGLDPFRVAETRNFLGSGPGTGIKPEYVLKLESIRKTVRDVLREARESDVIKGRFLLDPADLWVFEQGSGANLWKADFVRRCNGIYLPGKSDNDYELFLPVQLEQPFSFTEADRLRFESEGPHTPDSLTGDWYFQRPTGLDAGGTPTRDDGAIVTWEYTLPPGRTVDGQTRLRMARQANDEDLAQGFRSPLTPADVIAREFTRAITANPARRALLPQTSFFPERREHFMFGRLHLQRPPDFGDDPLGDGGTGRQLLLLKWLLEGAFVTATDEGGAAEFSPGAPTLTQIYAHWQRVGVPRAEGLEWGLFHDFAALNAKPFQTAELRLSSTGAEARLRSLQRSIDDAVAQQQASRLKKLGKAAIRATLARLAGDTNLNAVVTGVPAGRITDNSIRSFEHVILELARSSPETKAAFGGFAEDRDDLTEPPDLGDFLRAKNGDRDYLATILHEPGSYERFVTTTFEFLRTRVQRPTLSPYQDYTQGLRDTDGLAELQQRTENLNLLTRGRGDQPGLLALNGDRRIARMNLPLSVEVYGPGAVGRINLTGSRRASEGPPPNRARVARSAEETELDGEPITEVEGSPDQDAVVDGTEAGGAPLTLEGSTFETTVEQTIAGTSGEAVEAEGDTADNTLGVRAEVIRLTVPAPVLFPNELFAFINGFDELLTDWPALPDGHPRSPRVVLTSNDRILLKLIAPAGRGTLRVSGRGELDDSVVVRELAEVEPGVYQTADEDETFEVTGDMQDNERLFLRDEETLRFELFDSLANLTIPPLVVLVDRAEKATTGLAFSDRAIGPEPRPTVHRELVNQHFFFDNGDVQFGDDVGAQPVNGSNPMRDFLLNFGNGGAGRGEADLLYWLSHGFPDGSLRNHGRGLGGEVVVDPRGLPAADTYWLRDPEFLILFSCFALNDRSDVTGEGINVFNTLRNRGLSASNIAPGYDAWALALTNRARPLHAAFGFYRITGQRGQAQLTAFFNAAQTNSIVNAWRLANTVIPPARPWAVAYFDNNFDDRLLRVQRDPLPTDEFKFERLLIDDDVPDEEELLGLASGESQLAPTTEPVPERLPLSLKLVPLWPKDRVQLLPREPSLAGRWSLSGINTLAERITRPLGLELGAAKLGLIEVTRCLGASAVGTPELVGGSATYGQQLWGVPLLDAGLGLTVRDDTSGWLAGSVWALESQEPLGSVLTEAEARDSASQGQVVSPSAGRLLWRPPNAEGGDDWRAVWRFRKAVAKTGEPPWLEIPAVRASLNGGGR